MAALHRPTGAGRGRPPIVATALLASLSILAGGAELAQAGHLPFQIATRGGDADPFEASIDPAERERVDAALRRWNPEEPLSRRSFAAEIERLGSRALDAAFFALAAGEGPDADDRAALLRDTLARFDHKTTGALLERVARMARRPDLKSAALRSLGERGLPREIPLLQRCAGSTSRNAGEIEVLDRAFESGLARALAREPACLDALAQSWRAAEPRVAAAAARALGSWGDPRGAPVLIEMIGWAPEVDEAAVTEIGRIASRLPRRTCAEASERVRERLDCGRAGTMRAAAVALGRLCDTRGVRDLVRVVQDGAPEIRSGALWALRRISGLDLGPDAERWAAWQREEVRWFEEQAGSVVRDLRSGDPAEAALALQAVASHPVFRDEFGPEIGGLLRHRDAPVRRLACAVLGQAGTSAAGPALVAALEDEDEGVRAGAHEALTAITGLALPPDPYVWRRALRE